MAQLRAMIASPPEVEHVETIRAHLLVGVQLIAALGLYPPTRYTSDRTWPAEFPECAGRRTSLAGTCRYR